jgi:hypothetical protein
MVEVDTDQPADSFQIDLKIPQPIQRILRELALPTVPQLASHTDQHVNNVDRKGQHYDAHVNRGD